eukprot:1194470-Prorocentrum_minimum.AAC.2
MASTTLNCSSLAAKAHVCGRELQNKQKVKSLALSKSACVASLEQVRLRGKRLHMFSGILVHRMALVSSRGMHGLSSTVQSMGPFAVT